MRPACFPLPLREVKVVSPSANPSCFQDRFLLKCAPARRRVFASAAAAPRALTASPLQGQCGRLSAAFHESVWGLFPTEYSPGNVILRPPIYRGPKNLAGNGCRRPSWEKNLLTSAARCFAQFTLSEANGLSMTFSAGPTNATRTYEMQHLGKNAALARREKETP